MYKQFSAPTHMQAELDETVVRQREPQAQEPRPFNDQRLLLPTVPP